MGVHIGVFVLIYFDSATTLWDMVRQSPKAQQPNDECCSTPASGRRRNSKDTQPYLQLFKALADATRLEILGMLAATRGELCACDIEARFELSQPTVSHHLRLLREAGFIDGERRGTWVYYKLNSKALAQLPSFVRLLGG
jgi:ArsR family transcriptional regulator